MTEMRTMKLSNPVEQLAPARLRQIFGFRCAFVIFSAALFLLLALTTARSAEPIHALLITGGCCHDYTAQKKILTDGISARANVAWKIIHEGDQDGKEHK